MELIEIRISEYFHDGNDDRKIFRFCTCHNGCDGNLFHGGNTLLWLYQPDHFIARIGGAGKHPLDRFLCWRYYRESITQMIFHAVFHKFLISFVITFARKSLRILIPSQVKGTLLLFRQRPGQCINDLINTFSCHLIHTFWIFFSGGIFHGRNSDDTHIRYAADILVCCFRAAENIYADANARLSCFLHACACIMSALGMSVFDAFQPGITKLGDFQRLLRRIDRCSKRIHAEDLNLRITFFQFLLHCIEKRIAGSAKIHRDVDAHQRDSLAVQIIQTRCKKSFPMRAFKYA